MAREAGVLRDRVRVLDSTPTSTWWPHRTPSLSCARRSPAAQGPRWLGAGGGRAPDTHPRRRLLTAVDVRVAHAISSSQSRRPC